MPGTQQKTMIGILATYDDEDTNRRLKRVLEIALDKRRDTMKRFRLVFTGGTYDRLFVKESEHPAYLGEELIADLRSTCGVVRLPSRLAGGQVFLSYLVTQRVVSILWLFFTLRTNHLLNPANLALIRLSDQWHVKKLMNSGSVLEWLEVEGERDAGRNLRDTSLKFTLPGSETDLEVSAIAAGTTSLHAPEQAFVPDFAEAAKQGRLDNELSNTVIALISHDAMKDRMLDFVVDHEREIIRFKRVLATGTTGALVEEAAPDLRRERKVYRYHSGPKGGDIEIATEVLCGGCHVVIFFVDPLNPHPHLDDIRVVFGACMIQDQVRSLSHEMQAREWMSRVVRERCAFP